MPETVIFLKITTSFVIVVRVHVDSRLGSHPEAGTLPVQSASRQAIGAVAIPDES